MDINYSSKGVYWLGGEMNGKSGRYEWSDGSAMNFQVKIHRTLTHPQTFAITYLHDSLTLTAQLAFPQDTIRNVVSNDNEFRMGASTASPSTPHCLGLQRQITVASSSSGLTWALRPCSMHGGYVCKRPKATTRQSVMQNQTVVGSEGRLTSPGFPNAYPPNVDYSVKISGPERSRLIVQFQRLDLEYQDECIYDFVSVRDYKAGVEEKHFDPGTNPVPLAMLVTPAEGTSWSNIYRMERITESIEDNLMPSGKRSSTMRRSRKKRYMVNYIKGRGRFPGSASPSFQPYVRWCGEFDGNMSRFDFISSGNQALLHFHSDYAGGGTGFSAVWTAVDTTGCPVQTITAREGVIQSPNHPYFLLNNLDCTYIVQAPLGRKVWIEFQDFDIRDDALVTVDLLDGSGEVQPFVIPRVFSDGAYLSRGERMRVSLKTGAHPEGRGFKLVYRTVGKLYYSCFN